MKITIGHREMLSLLDSQDALEALVCECEKILTTLIDVEMLDDDIRAQRLVETREALVDAVEPARITLEKYL